MKEYLYSFNESSIVVTVEHLDEILNELKDLNKNIKDIISYTKPKPSLTKEERDAYNLKHKDRYRAV